MTDLSNPLRWRACAIGTAAALLSVACSAPAPSAPATAAPAQPAATAPPTPVAPAAPSAAATKGPRLVPNPPALDQWKTAAAERVHAVNSAQLFQGVPHHLLKAVIVVDITVDAKGNVRDARIRRSLGLKELEARSLRSLQASAPLPAPPPALLVRGELRYTETWLYTNDNRFQLRTLSPPQQ